MNSDLIPSTQASSPTSLPTSTEISEGTKVNRQQPIPPPSEPMQYRAIGLVRGRYQASAEQFTQGSLLATDGTQIEAVLLGRIISLVRNHLDLAQEHLWVVYPRTGQKEDNLHLQIVGVWEPENLTKQQSLNEPEARTEHFEQGKHFDLGENLPQTPNPSLFTPQRQFPRAEEPPHGTGSSSPLVEDGYFSVRGEVVFQSASDSQLVVKIKQAPRKEFDKPKNFKLKLQGVLKTKAVGQFWDFQVTRQADNLVVQKAEAIAPMPKPKPRKRFQPNQGATSNRSNFDTPRPVRKNTGSSPAVPKPIPKASTPKPNKRPKPPQ